MKTNRLALATASSLACLLAACGGGGGGLLRPTPAPAVVPPVAPPAQGPVQPGPGPCPAPLGGDCVVTNPGVMLDGRNSAHGLIVRLPVGQELQLGSSSSPYSAVDRQGAYTFAAGTIVEGGELTVSAGAAPNTLVSNVDVRAGLLRVVGRVVGDVQNSGYLQLGGRIQGNVANGGTMELFGVSSGNVINTGRLVVSAAVYGNIPTVGGDLTLAPAGTFAFQLAPPGWDSPSPLLVMGRAVLDGTLELGRHSDAWGPYPLAAPGVHHLLHAGGGVYGQFARWTSPGLFMEGSVRYGSHDVSFELTRISLAEAMAADGIGTALTLASAANLDRAFAQADGFARAPSAAQQRFLQSAAHIAWLSDPAQARRSVDSLAGALHADALHSVRVQSDAPAIAARLVRMRPGQASGAWAQATLHGGQSGFDQWLQPRLLAGASAGLDDTPLGTDASGGHARSAAPRADAYLRWFGDGGWHAGGRAGYAQHSLVLDRPIDLGPGGRWNAHSRRTVDIASIEADLGRTMRIGHGHVAPHAGLAATLVRSDHAIEQGQTGFELALQPATRSDLSAIVGVRYARDWRVGSDGWLQLDADASARRSFASTGDGLRAAFLGVPDTWFDLPARRDATTAAMRLGLRGGLAGDWRWSLDYARYLGGGMADSSGFVGLRRDF